MGLRVHDKASRSSGSVYSRSPHVRIRYAVQGQAQPRLCEEADKVFDKCSGVGKSVEQEVSREPQHVHLMEGRARFAAVDPQELCRTICRATLEQAKADAGDLMCIKCVDNDDDDHVNQVTFEKPQWKSYCDDLTGRELNRDMVDAARAEVLAVVKKVQVLA